MKKNFYEKRLEPVDGVLHGAGQAPDTFEKYFNNIGENKPIIYMTYISVFADHNKYFTELKRILEKYEDAYLIPQIGLGFVGDGTPESHLDPLISVGRFDEYIESFCEGLKLLGRPAFVRIGFEFSGEWNGYEPDTYKMTWKRITAAIRRHGIEDCAAVWCYTPDSSNKDYMSYYPGDEYVDWWSIDLFSPWHFEAPDTFQFMDDALKHGFPVIIGESTPRTVGTTEGRKSWEGWFPQYFGLIEQYPNMKAFCYINSDWRPSAQWTYWGDCRIENNEEFLEIYKNELKQAKYIHGSDEASVKKVLRVEG